MADELTISTVLVQDREQLRATLLQRIEKSAASLHRTASRGVWERWRRGGPQKMDERSIRLHIDDLNKCADLLGQIGWRD
jgi:hypothetical protein